MPKLIAHVFVSWVPEGLAHQVSVSVLAKLGVWELGSGPYVQCRRRAAQRLESVRRAPRGGNCHACWFLGAFVWGCGQGFAPPGVLNFGRAVGGPRLDRRVARSWLHFVCGSAVHTHTNTHRHRHKHRHKHSRNKQIPLEPQHASIFYNYLQCPLRCSTAMLQRTKYANTYVNPCKTTQIIEIIEACLKTS